MGVHLIFKIFFPEFVSDNCRQIKVTFALIVPNNNPSAILPVITEKRYMATGLIIKLSKYSAGPNSIMIFLNVFKIPISVVLPSFNFLFLCRYIKNLAVVADVSSPGSAKSGNDLVVKQKLTNIPPINAPMIDSISAGRYRFSHSTILFKFF